ncbi:HAD-like domain-containing protein [Collybia nuda]|uniref:HAD-like domain-containing protein n=1 Tax=Collybia nuda TaxID=64659 RepID=A0A9P6CGF7_9AGAR|nr:HAD-like domain-containing protein [Collybia nuda]
MVHLPIRLVTFDALYTLIVPRLPVHVQYSQVFAPHLGVLDPGDIRRSFRVAFRALETEQPVYNKGSQTWWSEVIKRTALGAGANAKDLDASLPKIVASLMSRFSSKEGYRAFPDAIPTIHHLRTEMNIFTAVVSNADPRVRTALHDLGFPSWLEPIVLSEEEGIEKPSPEIFRRTIARANLVSKHLGHVPIRPTECLHVGDEILSDYHGALTAGMRALLLTRPGPDGERAHKTPVTSEGTPADVVEDLESVIQWVKDHNGA